MPSQITAMSSGATMSCGKRAGASLANSPLATARSATAAHQLQAARDDLAIVELGDAGKRGPSAMIRRSSSLRLVPSTSFWNRAKKSSSTPAAGMPGIAAAALAWLDDGRHGAAHQLLEQRLLVLEIEVERALGDAGPRGHVVEPRRLEAVLGEHGERRIEDRLAACCGIDLAVAHGAGARLPRPARRVVAVPEVAPFVLCLFRGLAFDCRRFCSRSMRRPLDPGD